MAGISAGGSGSLGTLFVRLTANASELIRGMNQSTIAVDRGAALIAKRVAGMATVVTSALAAVGAASLREFAKFESSFAGVRKTVNATENQFVQLAAATREMAKSLPTDVNELNRIMELGGQLGISGSANLEKFTKSIAKFGIATGISADDASMSFAQIANVMQEPIANIDRMGSVVAQLGDAGAATEKQILEMGARIAGAGRIAGLTTDEVFSIASAFSSAGIEAEAGGSAIQKILLDLNNQGKRGIGEFVKFVEDLQKAGPAAGLVLQELGFEETRLQRAFLSVAGAGGLLNEQLRIGAKEWQNNSRLTEETEKRMATINAQFAISWNLIKDFMITLGEGLAPVIRLINEEFQTWLKSNEENSASLKNMAEILGSVLYASIKSAITIVGGLRDAFRVTGMAGLQLAETFLESWIFILNTIKLAIESVVNFAVSGVNKAVSLINGLMSNMPGQVRHMLGLGQIPEIQLKFELPDITSKLKDWERIVDLAGQELGQALIDTHNKADVSVEKTTDGYNEMVKSINAATGATKQLAAADTAATEAFKLRQQLKSQLDKMPSAENVTGRSLQFGFGQDPLMGQQMGMNREIIEAQRNLEVLRQIGEQEIALTQEQKDKKLALEKAYGEELESLKRAQMEINIMSAQQMFGDMATIAEAFAGRQSGIYKAMFAASKAFAIAESIIKIQQGIANAAAVPWPANLAAIASVVAATANIVSTIQSVKLTFAGERAHGGSVSAGKAYLVGERGPEPFFPGRSGTIMSNEDWMGRGGTTINVNNYTDAKAEVSEREDSNGNRIIDITVKRAKDELASEISQGTGNVNRALERNFKSIRGQGVAR